MKKTAVEWLVETLTEEGFDLSLHTFETKQAKAMEKEQIKMCSIKTMETCNSDMNELKCKTMDDYFDYIYNETFKSK